MYDAAVAVLKIASRAVQAARQAVAEAWGKVLALDPAQRAEIEARHAAKQAPSPAPAPQKAQAPKLRLLRTRCRTMHQVQQGPAPGM